MISIICVYNNAEIMKKYLLASLEKQTFKDYEIIKVDSKKYGFKSADEALNYGAMQAIGDLLLFCHQDVSFNDNCLYEIESYCKKYDFGLAGVAGTLFDKIGIFSNIFHGENHDNAGQMINQVTPCATLDECLLIVKKNDFMKFNSYESWHLYGTEYSLRCHQSQKKVLIFPIELFHLSPGWSLNNSYWKAVVKICKDYKNFKTIPTTVARFKNNCFLKFEILKMKIILKRGKKNV